MEDLGVATTGGRTRSLMLLGRADTTLVRALCDLDPVTNVFVAGRLETAGSADPHAIAGELWGYFEDGALVSAFWNGANIIPVAATPLAVEAFAAHLNTGYRRCSSIVGPSGPVLDLIGRLPSWSRPREVRDNQLVMLMSGPPKVEPDPEVVRARPADGGILFPASVAMFSEEVGYSPISSTAGGADYRRRVDYLVSRGWSFVRIEDGVAPWPAPGLRQVVFKADIGACSAAVAQVQGVWVHPARRGRRLAAAGMAAVALAARRDVAPLVSLYVNHFNERAIAAYRSVGFEQVGTFTTVLY